MEDILIKEVVTRKDLRDFIYLPGKIHRNEPGWLPPLYMAEWEFFSKKKNKSFEYSDTLLLLTYRGGRLAGRIMGIINRRYNAISNEQHGRFCFMECYNDREVFRALLKKIEDWARQKGMKKIVGPLGFSDKDPQGFQIEGFEYEQFITSPNNSPYMVSLIEGEGYEKKVDLVDYLGDIPEQFPAVYGRLLGRNNSTGEFRIIEFSSRKQLKPFIQPVLEIMNETFDESYAFVPLDDSEKSELASRYLPILDPRFVKVAERDGQLIGFALAIPDVSPAIKACRGKLFPFGFIKILRESRRTGKLLMLLGGIRREHRGKGVDVLMGVKILQEAIASNMKIIESHLVLEENFRMRKEYERIGCKVIKKFRIYQKDL